MSTTELIAQLSHLDNTDRLAVIEAASRMIREDLTPMGSLDDRLRAQATVLKELYEPGGELTEWTTLDSEEIVDDSSSR